jgi:hypothetical protein
MQREQNVRFDLEADFVSPCDAFAANKMTSGPRTRTLNCDLQSVCAWRLLIWVVRHGGCPQPEKRSMEEIVPCILGAVLGAMIWLSARGRARFALSILAVIVSAAVATIATGEYLESWVYLLLDLGEAAFGLAFGYLVAARLLSRRATRDQVAKPQR